jgi:hypothetical protein
MKAEIKAAVEAEIVMEERLTEKKAAKAAKKEKKASKKASTLAEACRIKEAQEAKEDNNHHQPAVELDTQHQSEIDSEGKRLRARLEEVEKSRLHSKLDSVKGMREAQLVQEAFEREIRRRDTALDRRLRSTMTQQRVGGEKLDRWAYKVMSEARKGRLLDLLEGIASSQDPTLRAPQRREEKRAEEEARESKIETAQKEETSALRAALARPRGELVARGQASTELSSGFSSPSVAVAHNCNELPDDVEF